MLETLNSKRNKLNIVFTSQIETTATTNERYSCLKVVNSLCRDSSVSASTVEAALVLGNSGEDKK